MSKRADPPHIDFPQGWPRRVKSAVLHAVALAQYVMTYTRGWAIDIGVARLRLKAENHRLQQEVALLREEIRIKDARMKRVEPQRRPHYVPTERMAILELCAARGWSAQQTADMFLVRAATISSWMRRLDEEGTNALIQIREPVNRFPDFVRYAVQRLKALCPSLVLQSRFTALSALLRRERRFSDSANVVFRPKTSMRNCNTRQGQDR